MSRVIDTLHNSLNDINDDPSLILDPLFMMNIFKEYRDQLPPFHFKKKQMKVIARQDGTKVVHFARLLKYLFNPTRRTDKETNDSDYCWANSTDERKAALIGVTATNDEAKSVLGGTTANIQQYGRINLSNAAAVSDVK
jgi:hypothetical protein